MSLSTTTSENISIPSEYQWSWEIEMSSWTGTPDWIDQVEWGGSRGDGGMIIFLTLPTIELLTISTNKYNAFRINKHCEGSCELLRFIYLKYIWNPEFNHLSIIMIKCTPSQFTVQLNRKPVYSATVQKTSLQYKRTENQFTVQAYRKPVYSISVQKTSLQYKHTENQFTVLW